MNTDENQSQLNNELDQAIESVKSALSQTTAQKNLLREKAVVAKNQVQDDVSFHLELLRNREVWLLEQVDVHAQMKEEIFESHLNELCALLAKLEIYQQLFDAPELQESHAIVSQAKQVLSRITKERLHSEETSGICFSGENFALSDAVKNFGRIVEGEPCESAQKLRRSHKWKSTSRESCREVMFIQEHFKRVKSSPQKDWLIAGGDSKEVRKDFGIVWKYFEELKKSDCKEWLYKKVQPMDLETVSDRFKSHFDEIKATPTADWLQSGVAVDDSRNSTGYNSFDTSANIKAWLLRPMESLSLSSKGDEMMDEGISLSRHCSLERSGSDKCFKEEYINGKHEWLVKDCTSPEGPIDDKIGDDWLLPAGGTSRPQGAQNGSWLQRFRESAGTSTSDWLIVAEAEPDYCEWLTQDSIDRCKSCPGECAKDTFSVFRDVLNSSKSEWLATATDW